MASVFSHALVALAMGKGIRSKELNWSVLLWGMLCSIVPDLDVVGFSFGIQYGDLWGHRGLTHSLFFATLLSGTLAVLGYRREKPATKLMLWVYFFLSTASHGILDAMTNGGLGVAFFSPFDTSRYFFAFRPVLVSPIGASEFFNQYGSQVLLSEMLWIWLPSGILFVALRLGEHMWTSKPS